MCNETIQPPETNGTMFLLGPSLLGAEFVRGRVCQGPSLSGAEMSRNHLVCTFLKLLLLAVYPLTRCLLSLCVQVPNVL